MEIWRDVINYKGIYQVSNLGRVKSLKRKGCLNDRILKPKPTSRGYLKVTLCINNEIKYKTVHQLVAEAFLNHTPCGMALVVDHIDNDKLNNCVNNLQVITQRENSYKNNRYNKNKK